MDRCIRLLVLALAIASAAPSARADDSRDVDLMKYRGGLLIRNGQQTSCEIALVDGTSAFIAASCVTDGDGKIDTGATYEIQVDHLPDRMAASAPLPPRSITVHPAYNPATFANNIAVIQFALNPDKRWHVGIAIQPSEWSGSMFVRRRMDDVSAQRWAPPEASWKDLSDPECAQPYGLYGANRHDFKCTSEAAPQMADSKCGVPFGTYYGVISGKPVLAGLYSHSVVDGDSLCSAKSAVHYYTMISNYIAFAQRVLGRDVTMVSPTHAEANSDPGYRMSQGSFVVPDGMTAFTGNEFAAGNDGTWRSVAGTADVLDGNAGAPVINNDGGNGDGNSNNGNGNGNGNSSAGGATNSGASTTRGRPTGSRTHDAQATVTVTVAGQLGNNQAPPAANGAQPGGAGGAITDLDVGDENEDDGDRHKKRLSQGQVAGIIIGVLVCIALPIGGFFFFRWWRRRHARRQWSPTAVQQILESHIVENEVGAPLPAKFDLPSYRHHRGTALVAAGPTR